MGTLWVHSQYRYEKNRPFSESLSGDSVHVDSVIRLIDSAFFSLPNAVQQNASAQRAVEKLKSRISRLRGTSATGSGMGRNWLSEDMADGWHIDIELSGTVAFT
ncbi:MAG TPA: hypothetical protein PLD47_06505 [Aggregatilineales bacterium]|nr:hypothetical protein [Anaerolineales bacterium]HRE47362.1 hypothetical protein [Aggregatilineales bacterium]